MEKIIDRLVEMGFLKTEAIIYVTLLKLGRSNGYKLAKELELSKSTIYQTLENMYKNGYILMIPNNSREYEAKSPEVLFEELEKRYFKNSISLKKDLSKVTNNKQEEYFYKLEGEENIKKALIGIIENSKREIYINTNFDLSEVREELKSAIERGVRIIVFCFNKLDNMGLKIEIYNKSDKKETFEKSNRIMLVSDLNKGLIVTKIGEKISGVYTDNKIFINIIAEHIHSDIYMAKLAKIYEDTFEDKIRINTLHERKNLIK